MFVAVLLCGALNGCAALTNPVADGVPARQLAPEFLASSREGEQTVPLGLLRQKPPDVYRLAADDVLGVWIPGILPYPPQENQIPPVSFSQRAGQRFPEREEPPPTLGLPFAVREDGTLALPKVDPVGVQGMTIEQALQAVRQAYTIKKKLLQPDEAQRIMLTLMRPRVHHILVFRHDNVTTATLTAGNLNNNFVVTDIEPTGAHAIIGTTSTGTGHLVDLPAYENDVLNALARTGGFPGTNGADELLIFRGYFSGERERALALQQLESLRRGCRPAWPGGEKGPIIRIPLRLRPGEQPAIRPEDVVLQTGDVVFVEARELELFYTAGLLPPGEHVLPRDFDLDVVQAVIRVRGPLVNGAFGGSNLSGALIQRGIGNPNPSLLTVLRRTPGGGQVPIRVDLNRALRDPRERILVQAGDVLVLQETPGEALARYFSEQFNFTAIWRVFTRKDAQGTAVLSTP